MSFNSECIMKRKAGARLTTLVKAYTYYEPCLDEQVLLAGVVNILTRAKIPLSKSEIYYCFKQNYSRDFHGDCDSYLKWLYSLALPSEKEANNSVSEAKEDIETTKEELTSLGHTETKMKEDLV